VAESEQGRIGPRLREARIKAGLSLSELSDLSGVSRAYVFRIETESGANPSLDVLTRIAGGLDMTVAELLGKPALRLDPDQIDVPPSLKAFADEAGLTSRELETLASIRWRAGESPRSTQRWRFIWQSLKTSRSLDEERR
jgi:transcriptional regulator with XRE-family HTH domain